MAIGNRRILTPEQMDLQERLRQENLTNRVVPSDKDHSLVPPCMLMHAFYVCYGDGRGQRKHEDNSTGYDR